MVLATPDQLDRPQTQRSRNFERKSFGNLYRGEFNWSTHLRSLTRMTVSDIYFRYANGHRYVVVLVIVSPHRAKGSQMLMCGSKGRVPLCIAARRLAARA
jgi:hypothetical protein